MGLRKRVLKILVEAGIGFTLWTGILSPYVLLVTHMSTEQYLSWLFMEALIVPPVAVIVIKVTNYLTQKKLKI
jgi:hypothetical protein